MHQLVPQFILNNMRAGQMNGSFTAVALFVDTSGFTVLTDTLMIHGQEGAEVLAETIYKTFNPMMKSVFEQGGFVSSQEGDAFTAIFPAKPCGELPYLNALTAAVMVQKQAASHEIISTQYGDFSIRVKVGIGLGDVNWAIIASVDGKRAAYYFRGEAIAQCTGAEQNAAPGEIWMTSDYYALVQPIISGEGSGVYYRLDAYAHQLLALAQLVEQSDPDMELAGQFFPRELFTWKVTGEFRQVAYLFVSLPTIRTDEQLALFMQTLFKLQDRYGGLLSRVGFGDKGPHLMLFWGAPVTHENDLNRLLNFILELQVQTAIPINGGIAYRIAHTGFIGSEFAEDFAPFGRGPNLAARYMTTAPRGEIWVDENTSQRTISHFLYEYAGEHTFKGFAQPQKVYKLIDRKEELDRPSGHRLIGRDGELTELEEFIQPIFDDGCPGLLTVWGEPGMGKTSLVQKFLMNLEFKHPANFKIFIGQSDEILREPFNPFRYWLRNYFQVSNAQGELRNKRNFNHRLDELINLTTDVHLGDELDRTRSFLGAMVDLYWPDSLYGQLDAQGRYENIVLGLASLLQAESLRQPVIFVLEDAQWLDIDTKAFLPRFYRTISNMDKTIPFAMIVTARPETLNFQAEIQPFRQISLDKLNPSELATIAGDILSGTADEDLLDLLKVQGEGNPFFTEQLVHYLKDENLLVIRDSKWGVIPRHEFELPTDVGSLLVARIDRLNQEIKEVVQTASIIGHEFELNLLIEMLHNQPLVQQKVAEAEKENIWSLLDETRYIFKHVLLRNAAYQMQIQSRREALHRLAFEALEKVYPDHPKHLYGEFAYHAEKGKLTDRALDFLILAGKAAQEDYLNKLAEDYLSRALELVPPDDIEKRFSILLSRESTYQMLGNNDLRLRDLKELEFSISTNDPLDKSIEVILRRAAYLLDTGMYPQAEQLAHKAVDLALSSGNDEKAAVGYKLKAFASLRQNKVEAVYIEVNKGLVITHKIGKKQEEGALLNILGLSTIDQNKFDLAQDLFQKCLIISEQTGNLTDRGRSLNNLGMVADRQGDYLTALSYYEKALELTRKTGDRSKQGIALGNMGWIAGGIGDYRTARTYTELNIQIAREVGDPYIEAYGQINLSAYASALGEYSNAETHALLGRDLAIKIGDRSCEAWALTYLGRSQMDLGKYSESTKAYQSSLEIRNQLDQPILAMEPLAGLAWSETMMNNLDTSIKHVEVILDHLKQNGLEGTDDPVRVFMTCYRILRTLGDPRSEKILKDGYQFLLARADKILDDQSRRMFIENIPSHIEITAAWKERGLH